MGYVFNQGLPNEFTFTEAIQTTYGYEVSEGVYSSSYSYYLKEPAQPFDIMPYIRSIMGSPGTYYYNMYRPAQVATSSYCFKIIISSSGFSVAWGSKWSGGERFDHTKSYTFENMPASLNTYFLYDTKRTGDLYTLPICDPMPYVSLIVYGGASIDYDILLGTVSSNRYELSSMNHYNVDPPAGYNVNEYYKDRECVHSAPTQQIPLLQEEGYSFSWEGVDSSMSTTFVGTDNEAPTPVAPPEPTPEDTPFEPSTPGPYSPGLDDTSDQITIPNNPVIGVTSAGFINVYKTSINALQGLGDVLFPSMANTSDIAEAVVNLYNVIANQNLINYVIDCHILPVSPQVGNMESIKVGYRNTLIDAYRVTNDYIDATCGSLSLAEYYSSFADYSSTRSKLYLPFIGFVDMLPEYWQAGTISVDYKFNIIDGSFMAYVRSISSKSNLNNSVIAQFGGNACIHFPVTGVNYANMVSGLVAAGMSVATAGSASTVAGALWSATNTFAQGGNVQQSNGYNSTTAMLGVRTPYLLIERLKPAWSAKYKHDKGLPSNIATLLSNVSGFTIIEDIDLSGIPMTEAEIEELRGLLKEGVYF